MAAENRYQGNEAQPVTELLKGVGAVVRAVRLKRGMSAQSLADGAGVSLRLIRQLEAGQANIAIGRLQQVASALSVHLGQLLIPFGDTPEIREGVYAFEKASVPLRRRAFRALTRVLATEKERTITLLGLRGAGKTSVGRALAGARGLPFIELDGEIERAAGLSLPEIFELHGDKYYRRLERKTLESIISQSQTAVVAVSGGLVQEIGTYTMVLEHTTSVWLKAAPELHMQRVRDQGDLRPMQDRDDAMSELRGILEARNSLYAQADITIDTTSLSLAEVVSALIAELDLLGTH
jgi:XRE family aerobic/anaerobic benzoate catabolism transcriptional regulator